MPPCSGRSAARSSAAIVGRILVEIVSPSESTRGDIRDKEIDRLGERVGNSFVVIGGVGALVLAMLDVDRFWIANTIYLGFVLAACCRASRSSTRTAGACRRGEAADAVTNDIRALRFRRAR